MKKTSFKKITLTVSSIAIGAALIAVPVMTAHSQTAPSATPFLTMAAPTTFETLAEKLLPTVVNVSTTTKIGQKNPQAELPPMPQLPPGSPFEDFFKDFYDQYKNNGPNGQGGEDQKVSALGSGFVIDAAKGYIVTNNHVIKDADEIKIILHDDQTLDAKLIGTDEKTDIAVLQVTPTKALTAATFGDSDTAKVGSWVLAIGNPFGLGGTVTAGIVSARQRDINAGPYDDFIQTDASINRGNSGGPMFNMNGDVIGVNTAIFSPTGGSVGIGFAVPSNIVKNVVDQLVKFGKTKRGWLGVRIQEVTPEIAESLGLDRARGALVSSVNAKGPADLAGIVPGDVIIGFNGQPLDHMRKLPRLVADTEVGKKAAISVWRKNAEVALTVDLGQLEKAEEEGMLDANGKNTPDATKDLKGTDVPTLGLGLALLNDGTREKFGIAKSTNGVIVTSVTPNSGAAEKGIDIGDVVMEIDQQPVSDPKTVADKVAAAEKAGRASVLLFVERKQDRRFVALKIKK